MFHGLEDVLSFVQPVPEERRRKIGMETYTERDCWGDLMRVTEGHADKELGRVFVGESRGVVGFKGDKVPIVL